MDAWMLLGAKIEVGEWLKLGMAAAVFIIYIVNYLINESKQSRKRQQQQRKTATPNTRANEPTRNAAPNQGASSGEIEDFLRRAAQQRQDSGRGKEQTARSQNPSPRPTNPREQRGAAAGGKSIQRVPPAPPPAPRRLVEQPVEAVLEIVKGGGPGSLSSSTGRRLSTEEFGVRASHMADDMTRADVEREQHLKRTFGRQVGKLTGDQPTTTESTDATAQAAAGVATAGLANWLRGDGLRYAVILNEIFARAEDRGPIERW